MFDFCLSDKLSIILRKLSYKDKNKVLIINKKIKEIINSNSDSINHYKNLKHDLKHFKRVHVDKHFVLIFRVDIENNYILFEDFNHHDRIYKN